MRSTILFFFFVGLLACQKSTQLQNESGKTAFESANSLYISTDPAQPFTYVDGQIEFNGKKNFIFAEIWRDQFRIFQFAYGKVTCLDTVFAVETCEFRIESDSMVFAFLYRDSIDGNWTAFTPEGQRIFAGGAEIPYVPYVPKQLKLHDDGTVLVVFSNGDTQFFQTDSKLYIESCYYEITSQFVGDDLDGTKKELVRIHFCGGSATSVMPKNEAEQTHGSPCNCPGVPKQ